MLFSFKKHSYLSPAYVSLLLSSCAFNKAEKPAYIYSIEASKTPIDSIESDARIYFRRHDYQKTVVLLKNKELSREATWLMAEALFRLGKYSEAKDYFAKLSNGANRIEKQKIAIRIFDIEILNNSLDASIEAFIQFQKEFKNPPARMRYALGKALYDAGNKNQAIKILRGIKKDNEFYMRAQYIVAASGLSNRKLETSLKFFKKIEDLTPVSVEDYAVRTLAILAQARILADNHRAELAEAAYMRVPLVGKYGDVATIELIRTMMQRAQRARLGLGAFKKASSLQRERIEKSSIDKALAAVARYRASQEIDWRKPELLTLMAALFVEAKRYEEAKLAYKEIIGHYRPILEELKTGQQSDLVWPKFALNYDRENDPSKKFSLVAGVPDSLVKDIKGVKKILLLKDRIEKSALDLKEQRIRLYMNGHEEEPENIYKARVNQRAIEMSYNNMVIEKQKNINARVAEALNELLAEAEFKHGELFVKEMKDVEKQINVVQQFESEKLQLFDAKLKAIDEGGSS